MTVGTVSIAQIVNPATGQWVRLTRPLVVAEADVDAVIAGYQQRLTDEWQERQRAMPDAQLQHIAGRHVAATPGRWYLNPERSPGPGKYFLMSDRRGHGPIGLMQFVGDRSQANVRFVLNAHRDIAALLAEVERLSSHGAPVRNEFKPLFPHDPMAGTHNFPVLDPLTVPHTYGPCACGRRMGETNEQSEDGAE